MRTIGYLVGRKLKKVQKVTSERHELIEKVASEKAGMLEKVACERQEIFESRKIDSKKVEIYLCVVV